MTRLLTWDDIEYTDGRFGRKNRAVFSTEMPDLKSMIDDLNLMKERQRNALIIGMHEAGDIIVEEQKRLIRNKSERLADAIKHDGVGFYNHKYFNSSTLENERRQAFYIRCGYLEDAFETDADGFNPGVIGMMHEFGRPGQSPQRSGKTMKQKRKRRKKVPVTSNRKNAKGWKYSEAELTEVEINKGLIAPVPHIRRGMDNTAERAVNVVAAYVEEALERVWDEDE